MVGMIKQFDFWLFDLINRNGQNAFFDSFMPFISNEKNFYIVFALGWLFLLLNKKVNYRVIAVAILLLIGVTEFLCSDVLKPTFQRLRPYHALSHVHLYNRINKTWEVTPKLEKIVKGRSQSMPSAHATNIFAGAFFLAWFFRRLWPAFLAIAVLVGYSRVYLGVHYPLDVFVGALVGILCALGAVFITNRILKKWGMTSPGANPPKRKQA